MNSSKIITKYNIIISFNSQLPYLIYTSTSFIYYFLLFSSVIFLPFTAQTHMKKKKNLLDINHNLMISCMDNLSGIIGSIIVTHLDAYICIGIYFVCI